MKRGTVVLTPFPFTDLTAQKVRPAVVLSRSDRADGDVLLAFITSHRGQAMSPAELLITSNDADFSTIGLKVDSVVRLDKIVTLHRSVLLGELGELPQRLLRELDERLRYALELS